MTEQHLVMGHMILLGFVCFIKNLFKNLSVDLKIQFNTSYTLLNYLHFNELFIHSGSSSAVYLLVVE